MDEALLRSLTPAVIGILVRRGADFAAAEDAVQDALIEAVRIWPVDPPRDPKGWLVTTAWRKFLDAARADTSRRHREARFASEPLPTPGEEVDDTLQLYFLCAHPSLTPASAVALTLRAIGGLTTRQIAQAYLVPEATMAQRISRAKRTVSGVRLNQPGDVATVLRVLYLVFNEGYSGDIDLAGEAIRLTRQLAAKLNHEEVAGLLALMLLHHARRPARLGPDGRLVPLAEQDRSLWNTRLIAEGVDLLQAALARDRLGEFQAQAAIAALHADARTVEETDWVQIVEWYDELVSLTDSPVARLNRAVAVGEADSPRAGLAALAELDPALPRYAAVAAYLHERDGDPVTAARLYADAARSASSLPERDHLTRQAARLNEQLRTQTSPHRRNQESSMFTIRPVTPDDLSFLSDMLWEAAAVADVMRRLGKEAALARPENRKYLEGWGRPGDFGVIAVNETDRPLGAAWARLFPANQPGYGFIAGDVPELSIGVSDAARGQGVGGALIDALVEAARDAGYRAVSLSVDRGNPALRLYERHGFRDAGVSDASDSSLTMVRDLKPDGHARNAGSSGH